MELVNSIIADVAIKERTTEESILGVVKRRVSGNVEWGNINFLGVVGIDEISLKKGYRDFVTIISNRVGGKINILAVLKGREKATIVGFLKSIAIKLINTIEAVCVDMHDGYINAVKEVFNNKISVVDDLLTQFNEAIIFLQKHLNVRSEIKGVNRKDICEIPLEALREAVANAIIHRDYSMRGTSIMVEVYQDRVVISNPGGLMAGLDTRFLADISVRRNELIADMFARMDKVERMGTGINRMRAITKAADVPEPKFTSNLFFTITFKRPMHLLKGSENVSEIMSDKPSEIMSEKILELISKNKHISSKKIAKILNLTPRSIERKIPP